MRKQPKSSKASAEREFVLALGLHLPGLEFVGRNLEPAQGEDAARAVEFIGRASGGRLVLVASLRGASAQATHAALELAAFARQHAEELRQRFECAHGPTLALLCDEPADELGQLLAPLLGEDVQLFARRAAVNGVLPANGTANGHGAHAANGTSGAGGTSSANGASAANSTRLELVPIRPASAPHAAHLPRAHATRASFLAALDEEPRALASWLWERLASPALGATLALEAREARWSDVRGPLCSLEVRGRALAARLAGLEEPIELESPSEGRGFLDAVVARRLEHALLDLGDPAEGPSQAAFDPRQPILTAAEIAAFHD